LNKFLNKILFKRIFFFEYNFKSEMTSSENRWVDDNVRNRKRDDDAMRDDCYFLEIFFLEKEKLWKEEF